MSKFWVFIWAVASHWAVLMTGGVITALLMAIQYWLQSTLSWRFYKGLIVVFIALACFLAWRDEYGRAQNLLTEKADLAGRLREREHRIEELRSGNVSVEHLQAIERLETANAQLTAELRASQDALMALENSLKPRRLSPEERRQLMNALARYDGQEFGVMSIVAGPSCQECMLYRDELIETVMSVPEWSARGDTELSLRPDLTGIIIGVKDPKTPPPKVEIMADILKAANLPFRMGTTPYLSPDKFILIIGNKP